MVAPAHRPRTNEGPFPAGDGRRASASPSPTEAVLARALVYLHKSENTLPTTTSEKQGRCGRPRKVTTAAEVKEVLRNIAEPHRLHIELWSLSSARLRRELGRGYRSLVASVGARVVDPTYHHGSREKSRTKAWSIPFLEEELGIMTTTDERLGLVEERVDDDGRQHRVVLTEVRRDVLLQAYRDESLDPGQRRLLKTTLHRGRLRSDGRFVVREEYRVGEERPQDKRRPGGRWVRTPRHHVDGGGLQGITTELRERLLSGLGYFELDLKNAHPVVAFAMARERGIGTPALERYVHHREEVITAIVVETGAPYAAVKSILLALFNGGGLQVNKKGQVWENLEKARVSPELIRGIAKAVVKHPMVRALMKDARSLLPDDMGPGGLWYLFTDFEQLLIDEVIKMVGEENVRVLIHDGLVVAGQVPEAELEGFKAWGYVLGIDPDLVVLKQVEL